MLVHRGLVRFGFEQLKRTRKTRWAIIVSLVPLLAGVALFLSDMRQTDPFGADFPWPSAFADPVAFMILGGTVPFVRLLLASGLVADESEDRTLSYLLVRPISRRSLYLSRLIPLAATSAALAALQVLLLALTRLFSYVAVASGAPVASLSGESTMNGALAVLLLTPMAVLVAALVGVLFTTIFGFISLLSTRYHVYISIGVFVAWELPFGISLIGGPGFFTVLFHAVSAVFWFAPDQTRDGLSHPFTATLWLLAATALWLWLGLRRVERQDFPVTSAAT